MKKKVFIIAVFCCVLFAGYNGAAASQKKSAPPGFPSLEWGAKWSGNWTNEKNMEGRLEGRLGERVTGLSFRLLALDRRPAEFWEKKVPPPLSKLGAGLYHKGTDSRLLFGLTDEAGLAARLRNISSHSSWVESHKDSGAELRTTPQDAAENLFLYIGSPALHWGGAAAQIFSSLMMNDVTGDELTPTATAGGRFLFANGIEARAEGLFHRCLIPPRAASSWFSDKPPLPERESRLSAGSFLVKTAHFQAAGDLAVSETFAVGRGFYGNAALKVGKKPWAASVFFDGTGNRFVGTSGATEKPLTKIGLKGEWRGKKSSSVRAQTILKASAAPADNPIFNQSSNAVTYQFPVTPKERFQFTRIGFDASRNRDAKQTRDKYALSLGMRILPVRVTLKTEFHRTGDVNTAQGEPFPFPAAAQKNAAQKYGGDLYFPVKSFTFRAGGSYTALAEGEDYWTAHGSAAFRHALGKNAAGSLSLKAAYESKKEDWSVTFAWRLAYDS